MTPRPHRSLDEWLDGWALRVIRLTRSRRYFLACILLCAAWVPTGLLQDFNTWQLEINTLTTIVTFLMVALLGPSESESQRAIHEKLDALASGLVVVLTEIEADPASERELRRAARRLGGAIGKGWEGIVDE